jgi:hypothetical protein
MKAGAITREGVFLLPYGDHRWRDTDLDGTLGLNFFSLFNVTADWHTETIYLSKRAADSSLLLGERLRRWGSTVLDACPVPACLETTLLDDPTAAGHYLQIQRTQAAAELSYDVLFEAIDAVDSRLPLPHLLAALPAGEASVLLPIDAPYIGARLRILDINPFPRECTNAGGCLWQLADTL